MRVRNFIWTGPCFELGLNIRVFSYFCDSFIYVTKNKKHNWLFICQLRYNVDLHSCPMYIVMFLFRWMLTPNFCLKSRPVSPKNVWFSMKAPVFSWCNLNYAKCLDNLASQFKLSRNQFNHATLGKRSLILLFLILKL